jgi:hypothetical protein
VELKVNDIVQVVPTHKWAGCLIVVSEIKSWGIQGYVQMPLQGQAYIRLKFEEIEKVGEAIFVLSE